MREHPRIGEQKMTSELTINITKETKKALYVELSDGRQGWIQRRWMRADGTLTPAGEANLKSPAQIEEDRKPKFVTLKVIRESEKAVLARFDAIDILGNDLDVDLWVPKSQLDSEGRAPCWLIEKKATEYWLESGNRSVHVQFEAHA